MTFSERFVFQVCLLVVIFLLETFLPFFDQRKGRLRHAWTNGMIGVLNGVFSSVCFSLVIVSVLSISQEKSLGFLGLVSFPYWVETILGILFLDMWMYFWHRWNHALPLLWRFHRVHHSDTQMDSTTALRFHVGEIFFSVIVKVPILLLLGLRIEQLLFYEIVLHLVIFFHHSNIHVPEKCELLLRKVMVTPNMHRVHHSQNQSETDSNYSSVFSFWDKLLGTYNERKDVRNISFGLEPFREEGDQTFNQLLKMPFIKK